MECFFFLDFEMQNGISSKNNTLNSLEATSKFNIDSFFSNSNIKNMNGFNLHNQSHSMDFNNSNNYKQINFIELLSNEVICF